MNQKLKYTGTALAGVAVIAAVILFPVLISHLQDGRILDITHLSVAEGTSLGYRHELSVAERLELLRRSQNGEVMQRYEYRSSSYMEKEHAAVLAKEQIEELKKQGILPAFTIDFDKAEANVQLFSYIDLNAPSLNVSLWQVEFYFNDNNGYIQVTVDTKMNKIYDFQMAGQKVDGSFDLQQAAEAWGDYLGMPSLVKAEDRSQQWGFDEKQIQGWYFAYEQEQKLLEYTYLLSSDKKLVNLYLNSLQSINELGMTNSAAYGWGGKNQSVKIK
jgi:hypothetical protein